MNKNTSGAMVVLIVALAGIYTGNMVAWLLAVVTAAIAFLTEELREFSGYEYHFHGSRFNVDAVATILAGVSWLTILAAVFAFAI